MTEQQPPDKRFSFLLAGVAFNTLTSLTAIGLWFFAPNHAPAERNPPTHETPASTAPNRPPLPGPRFPPPPGPFGAQPPPPGGGGDLGLARPLPRIDARLAARGSDASIPASTQELAARLALRADALASGLGDQQGVVPKDYAKRLEHAFEAATSLAKQRKLDESQTQSLVAILTYYEFSVLREEKSALPGPVDPTRIEDIREQQLTDIQTTCGEETRKAAELEIERW